ncbi:DUF2332 domain-containing protein [Luedemannella helvata]|uniref:DUF2332 domain-containing protein n=1 Tax=Luedemannella helvata TaxID=349315 RepID=A0ABP4WMV9_9ACTN
MSTDLAPLAETFAEYARDDFAGMSPLYVRLSRACAQRPRLGAALLAAPPTQRRPLLFFAAVQYLLRTRAQGHPLARYLPVLHGEKPADDGLAPALADLVSDHHDALAELCAARTTQTNEAGRAAYLWPALGRLAAAFGDRPLHLIELGTSAGLLLMPDRYAYRYPEAYGRPDAPEPLIMACDLRSGPSPAFATAAGTPARIAGRVGVDLRPIEAGDADAVTWLRSCVWPEQTQRLARLDAALAEAAAVRPRLVAGDLVDALPRVLSSVGADAVPVVFASHALTYLSPVRRAELVGVLAATGAQRDLAMIVNESDPCGVDLFAATASRRATAARRSATLATATWVRGRPSVEELGTAGPHGAWLDWSPHSLAPASHLRAG